jgi:hypothetical protein
MRNALNCPMGVRPLDEESTRSMRSKDTTPRMR